MEILFRGCPPSKTSLFHSRDMELKSRNCTMTENESAQGIWITFVRIGSRLTVANQGVPFSPYDVPGVDWSPFVLSMATVMT